MAVANNDDTVDDSATGDDLLIVKLSEEIQFTDATLNADEVLWDFGNGDFSSDRNPLYTYYSNGVFNVILTAVNDFGEASTTQTITISSIGEMIVDPNEEQQEEETQ